MGIKTLLTEGPSSLFARIFSLGPEKFRSLPGGGFAPAETSTGAARSRRRTAGNRTGLKRGGGAPERQARAGLTIVT